jgi:hypothetical protein
MMKSVKWLEIRDSGMPAPELVYVISELSPEGQWSFFEREAWETRWYPVSATTALVARATAELNNLGFEQNIAEEVDQT